jgi:peptidoglycan/LPS O-acetylase OafA/YrhL
MKVESNEKSGNAMIWRLQNPQHSQALASRQIFGLDVVRFLAALFVVGTHLAFWLWAGGFFPTDYHYLGRYTWAGWVGVEMFFVLSGFIIAYSAEKATALNFAKSRFIRLYPAAWVCSTLTVILLLVSHTARLGGVMLKMWIVTLTLFPRGPWIDGSYWTLEVELSFYALIFVLLAMGRFRNLDPVMSLVGLISSGSWVYVFATRHSWVHPGRFGKRYAHFLVSSAWSSRILLYHGCFFAIGSILWLCLFHSTTLARLLTLVFCCFGAVIEILDHGHYLLIRTNQNYQPFTPVGLWFLCLAAIIASVKYNTALGTLLGTRGTVVTRRLGIITYPLYLIHQQVGYILIADLHNLLPDIVSLILVILLMVASSFFISGYLESPIQRYLGRILPIPKKTSAEPAVTVP